MNIDNQYDYWDNVAESKSFTHPLNTEIVQQFFHPQSILMDFGCGYGRIIKQLQHLGYTNVKGFDTSKELISRGKKEMSNIFHIQSPADLPIDKESLDGVLLFAVLTCIPSNEAQKSLIQLLHSKLKPGGLLYISDYYLQQNSTEVKKYTYLNNDKYNYGVFTLPEGVVFRHHTKEWITELLQDFNTISNDEIEVMTMNGNKAKGFQLLVRK